MNIFVAVCIDQSCRLVNIECSEHRSHGTPPSSIRLFSKPISETVDCLSCLFRLSETVGLLASRFGQLFLFAHAHVDILNYTVSGCK